MTNNLAVQILPSCNRFLTAARAFEFEGDNPLIGGQLRRGLRRLRSYTTHVTEPEGRQHNLLSQPRTLHRRRIPLQILNTGDEGASSHVAYLSSSWETPISLCATTVKTDFSFQAAHLSPFLFNTRRGRKNPMTAMVLYDGRDR